MPAEVENTQRRLAIVVGTGRSGTSTLAVALKTLGMHVPQPEVLADDANPRGFGETRWIVDLHSRLLRKANVQTSDARPSAWDDAESVARPPRLEHRVADWLEGQFGSGDQLVVKDPRLAWFLGLWRSAAVRVDARPFFLTMLRPVPEVVRSRQHYYSSQFGESDRVAGWINTMLHTELATRGSDRSFIRYDDLLTDWRVPLGTCGERFGIRAITDADEQAVRRVDEFIDPSLRRIRASWDDLEVPPALRGIAEATWTALNSLADGENEASDDTFDRLRGDYVDLYRQSEAIAQSSLVAAQRQKDGRLIQRLARRVPYGVRTRIPPSARGRLEGAVKRLGER